MALEWMMLAILAAGEAIFLIMLTLPALHGLRKGLIQVSQQLMQPLLAAVPLAAFLGLDIYWKLQNLPPLTGHPGDLERRDKMVYKSQRNMLLVFTTLFFYWLIYRVSRMLIRLERLTTQVSKIKSI